MRTAVVLLNYNGLHWLRSFLPLVVERSPEADVAVIDNGSTEPGTLEWLKSEHPSVTVIALERNLGYAGGYQEGLRQLEGDDLAVLMNTDIEPLEGWLAPLTTRFAQQPRLGAIQPKLRSHADPEYFEYAGAMGGRMDRWGIPFAYGRVLQDCALDRGQYDSPSYRPVFWASGACMAVRLEAYWAVGGLDPAFFAHMEEIDLCWRLHRHGWSVEACSTSTVLHVGGGTLSVGSPRKTYLNVRNSLLTVVRNAPTLSAMRIVAFRLLLDGAAGLRFLLQRHPKHTLAVIQAHFAFYQMFSRYAVSRDRTPKRWPEYGVYPGSLLWDRLRKRRAA